MRSEMIFYYPDGKPYRVRDNDGIALSPSYCVWLSNCTSPGLTSEDDLRSFSEALIYPGGAMSEPFTGLADWIARRGQRYLAENGIDLTGQRLEVTLTVGHSKCYGRPTHQHSFDEPHVFALLDFSAGTGVVRVPPDGWVYCCDDMGHFKSRES